MRTEFAQQRMPDVTRRAPKWAPEWAKAHPRRTASPPLALERKAQRRPREFA